MSVAPPDLRAEAKTRHREWLLRAAFEAVLILFGLLAALGLNQWQDALAREARVDVLLSAIRAELEQNYARHAPTAAFNTKMADLLWNAGNKGVEFLPPDAYPDGLFRGPALTSAAWSTAQNDTASSEIPIDTMLMLARVYEQQRIYIDDFTTLANNMYAAVLDSSNATVRVDGIAQPGRLGGVLRDYARHARELVATYRGALVELGVDPAALAPETPPGEPANKAP